MLFLESICWNIAYIKVETSDLHLLCDSAGETGWTIDSAQISTIVFKCGSIFHLQIFLLSLFQEKYFFVFESQVHVRLAPAKRRVKQALLSLLSTLEKHHGGAWGIRKQYYDNNTLPLLVTMLKMCGNLRIFSRWHTLCTFNACWRQQEEHHKKFKIGTSFIAFSPWKASRRCLRDSEAVLRLSKQYFATLHINWC